MPVRQLARPPQLSGQYYWERAWERFTKLFPQYRRRCLSRCIQAVLLLVAKPLLHSTRLDPGLQNPNIGQS